MIPLLIALFQAAPELIAAGADIETLITQTVNHGQGIQGDPTEADWAALNARILAAKG